MIMIMLIDNDGGTGDDNIYGEIHAYYDDDEDGYHNTERTAS